MDHQQGQVVLDSTLGSGVLCCPEGGWIRFGAGGNQVVPDLLTRQGLCEGFYEAPVDVQPTAASTLGARPQEGL